METTPRAAAIEFSQEIGLFCTALAAAQAKIKNAERDAENPYFNSSYASLAAVWDAVRAPMTENGLSVIQGEATRIAADLSSGEVDVTTMVLHASGQWFRTTVTLPVIPMASRRKGRGDDGDNDADRAPGRITPQAIGSAITYGRRYGLESVTGTAPEAEDDDGNSASGAEKRQVIPAGGVFEDAIESVTFEEKPKKTGGTFTVCAVKTAKHGSMECWENVGRQIESHAGTGVALRMKAERGNYGWKLLEAQPIQAATEGTTTSQLPNWKSQFLKDVSEATTPEHLRHITELLKKGGVFNEETKAILKAKGDQLAAKAPEMAKAA